MSLTLSYRPVRISLKVRQATKINVSYVFRKLQNNEMACIDYLPHDDPKASRSWLSLILAKHLSFRALELSRNGSLPFH